MRHAVVETREVAGGIVARCEWPCGQQVIHGEAFVPWEEEVGRFGRRLKKAGQALARSKVLRGIARTAANVAKATPYGQAASAALNVARQAARAARGEGRRASALSRGTPPSRGARGRARGSRLSSLNDAQRLDVVRMVLRARGSSRMKLALIAQAVG